MSNPSELQFQQNEDLFRTLIEESPTPIALYVGREMMIRVANKTILDIWGKGDHVINRSYYDILPELESQAIFKILDDVYTSGVRYQGSEALVILTHNGQPQNFYFNFSFKPLKDANGNVWGIINTADDVTELVLTRQRLAESEERTHFALNSAELGTWDLDPINEAVIWDARCHELFGFRKEDQVGYSEVLSCIHPDDTEYVRAEVAKAVNKNTTKPYDIKYRTIGVENHKLRWIRAKGKAYFNENGICSRFAGTILDITREVADAEEQQKLIAVVDNANEMIGVSDLEGKVTYMNNAGLKILGIGNLEKAMVHASEYFMPFDLPKVEKEAMMSLMGTGKWESEVHYRNFTTGEQVPTYLNVIRIDDPITGKPMAIASVARDLRPERESRSEQDKLLTLIDHTSDFVSLSDLEGNVSYVNAAGKKMLGLDNDEEIKRHNSDYIMPGEVAKLKNKINRSLEKEGKWEGAINYRHFKTGEAIPVYGTTMLVYDGMTGKPQGRATLARDLRPEIANKQALVESEQLLQNITAAAPVALWMSDENGGIVYANQTWTEWTGYAIEDILGTGWLNAILPEDRKHAADKFMSDLSARAPYEVAFRIKRKDGEVRSCIASGSPQFNAEGVFTGYIGTCVDITDKLLSDNQLFLKNEELNNQLRQFEFVTGFMPVQLWTSKTDGQLDYVNKTALEFFGASQKDIVGPEWLEHVHPEDREPCIAAWTHSLQTGDPYQFEFRLRDKHGVYKWHLARALPYKNNDAIVKWFGTNTDIDEQKQLQRQKDDFLGIASHELKTPVTSIKAYAQVLGAMLTREGENKKAEMVARMDAQVNRLTNLIGDLLDVTKINSGRLQFNSILFDFNQVIKETVDDLQHTTQRHTLIQHLNETGEIFSDKDRISQVITNLITNAIKYSPHSDKIIINTKKENNEVIMSVQDFGIGIAEDKADRVFEQFYRVSGDKQHTFPGLGLGLYISSEIIKREGGRMWVNSIEGKGSTFCFALPANNEQATK